MRKGEQGKLSWRHICDPLLNSDAQENPESTTPSTRFRNSISSLHALAFGIIKFRSSKFSSRRDSESERVHNYSCGEPLSSVSLPQLKIVPVVSKTPQPKQNQLPLRHHISSPRIISVSQQYPTHDKALTIQDDESLRIDWWCTCRVRVGFSLGVCGGLCHGTGYCIFRSPHRYYIYKTHISNNDTTSTIA